MEAREVKLREKVKAAGGRWDPKEKVWHVPMGQVLQLGLCARVAKAGAIATPDSARERTEGDSE
jgi:hypothetical protein